MSFTIPYSKLYVLTELRANDVKVISAKYTYVTVNSIFVKILRT